MDLQHCSLLHHHVAVVLFLEWDKLLTGKQIHNNNNNNVTLVSFSWPLKFENERYNSNNNVKPQKKDKVLSELTLFTQRLPLKPFFHARTCGNVFLQQVHTPCFCSITYAKIMLLNFNISPHPAL